MKKTLAFMVALFSLAGVVLLLSGCAALEKQPAEIGTSGPPHQLIFYNKEELAAFLDALNLSDTELEQFLDDNDYSMNGVDSREEPTCFGAIVFFSMSFRSF